MSPRGSQDVFEDRKKNFNPNQHYENHHSKVSSNFPLHVPQASKQHDPIVGYGAYDQK